MPRHLVTTAVQLGLVQTVQIGVERRMYDGEVHALHAQLAGCRTVLGRHASCCYSPDGELVSLCYRYPNANRA